MKEKTKRKQQPAVRCAIYTRKSTNEGLDQEFNTLDAQREAAEAYIASQQANGWKCLTDRYDDGGFTGANIDRPALARLLEDIEAGKIDAVVVYKVDRLSRSLLDFARMMETFQRFEVSFVSVTQHFNTATSMGRLILNILIINHGHRPWLIIMSGPFASSQRARLAADQANRGTLIFCHLDRFLHSRIDRIELSWLLTKRASILANQRVSMQKSI